MENDVLRKQRTGYSIVIIVIGLMRYCSEILENTRIFMNCLDIIFRIVRWF